MKQKVLFLLTLFSIASMVKAQDTEFWFVAPDLAETNDYDNPLMFAIANNAEVDASVTIVLYNNGSPIVTTQTIASNGLWKYDIPRANIGQIENPRGSAGNVTNYGVHIRSTVPVMVYYQCLSPYNQISWSLKGTSALGTEFYVPMVHDSHYYSAPESAQICDQIDIVASEDGTTVTVVPTAQIRIGASSSSSAGTPITRILNKGETLKIMEHIWGNYSGAPSLAGTKITSDKPIAVTTTEDYLTNTSTSLGRDGIGDQIVPVSSLGKSHVVTKGFLRNVSDRVHFVATVNGTIITVNSGTGTLTTSATLNAGDSWLFDLGTGGATNVAPRAIFSTANHPVYCYHISGVRVSGEELGSSLIPSVYSIGQSQFSFYQHAFASSDTHYGFVVFRTGSHDKFLIKQGSGAFSSLLVSPIPIPGITEWQAAKISLSSSGQNQVVTIKNTGSPFSLGYFQTNSTRGGSSYAYLSGFGEFRFPYDVIYKCPDASVTLEGGSASSYKWEHATTSNSGPYTTLSETGRTLSATDEGYYKLTMAQEPDVISNIVEVRNLDFQAAILPSYISPQAIATTFSTSISSTITSDPNLDISYLWEFEGGLPITSTEASPTVTWTSGERTAKVTITAESRATRTIGSCSVTVMSNTSGFYISPVKQEICIDDTIEEMSTDFYISDADTYQWQYSIDNITWTDISGATAYTYEPVYQKPGTAYYRIVITDKTGTETLESVEAKIILSRCIMPVNPNIHIFQ